MEQFIVGIIVGTAILYILNRFRNYLKAARFSGSGGCGTCGCKTLQKEDKIPELVPAPAKKNLMPKLLR